MQVCQTASGGDRELGHGVRSHSAGLQTLTGIAPSKRQLSTFHLGMRQCGRPYALNILKTEKLLVGQVASHAYTNLRAEQSSEDFGETDQRWPPQRRAAKAGQDRHEVRNARRSLVGRIWGFLSGEWRNANFFEPRQCV